MKRVRFVVLGCFCFSMFLASCSDGNIDIAPKPNALMEGQFRMERGDYEDALKAFKRALVEEGVDHLILSAIGSVELRLGRTGEAERVLNAALRLGPEHAPTWNNLGVVYLTTNRVREAQEAFEMALNLSEGDQNSAIERNLENTLERLTDLNYENSDEDSKFRVLLGDRAEYYLVPTSDQM